MSGSSIIAKISMSLSVYTIERTYDNLATFLLNMNPKFDLIKMILPSSETKSC